MNYRIGSFNVCNLSYGNNRDLDRIANIIKDNKLDIIALQEVLSEGKMLSGAPINSIGGMEKVYERSLLKRLGNNWECRWVNPMTKSTMYPYLGKDSRGEGYAFLWNKNRVELAKKRKSDGTEVDIEPYAEHRYSIKDSAQYTALKQSGIRLIRDPAVGIFKIKNRPAEIRLIDTHIVYGKPKEGNLKIGLEVGAVLMRRSEFDILAGWIYKKTNDITTTTTGSSTRCTVLLGDYNLNLEGCGKPNDLIRAVAYYDSNGRKFIPGADGDAPIKMYTLQTGLTTLKQKVPELANNYDHFTVNAKTKETVTGYGVIDAIHQRSEADADEESKFNTYRTKVSDHLPIVLEIRC